MRYGHICHILAAPTADGTSEQDQERTGHQSFVLKYITPPHIINGSKSEEGHIRKLLSYQVELAFYTHLAPLLPPYIAVASCHASLNSSEGMAAKLQSSNGTAESDFEFKTAMLLTDLRPAFPVAGEKRATLTETQVHAALEWLAGFHGFWWDRVRGGGDGLLDRSKLVRPPLQHLEEQGEVIVKVAESERAARVWLYGGYTYLATRQSEYGNLCEEGTEWSEALCQPLEGLDLSVAELVAQALAPKTKSDGKVGMSEYETLIHGDVKSENLFTNKKGDKVAFFDFQYVGLGFGVCDLAKLFTCSVPRSMLGKNEQARLSMGTGEERLLRCYIEEIRRVSGRVYDWEVFVRHWETALVDWLRFQASWGFWGNTEWLEGRVRSILHNPEWLTWLRKSTL
ncbi:hypothetical protein N0V82_003482 [Gnomoniopsis sp. IMI 355080]|nr:hypothetical protein N0V82_003482 [Gnomoniopsis sp. IMI 355080]